MYTPTPTPHDIPRCELKDLPETARLAGSLPSGSSLYLTGKTADKTPTTKEERDCKHCVLQQIRCRHPKPTKQVYDFHMNLDIWSK